MCLAIPGQVIEIYEAFDTRMGRVNFGGVVKEVCLAYVHVGFAITRVDEESAQRTLETFREMGLLEEEFGNVN